MFDGDPAYARVATEPSLLANGELTSAQDDHRNRLREPDLALEMFDQFFVSQRLASGARQRCGFTNEPRTFGVQFKAQF